MATRVQHNKTVFSASDKISPTLVQIQKKFRTFANKTKALNRSLASLGKITFAPLMASFAGLGAIAIGSVKSFAEFGASVDDASRSLGINAEKLQELRYAASQNGASVEAMDGAIKKLNVQLSNVAQGKGKDVVDLANHLGISLRNADGSMRDTADLMPEIADAMTRQTNATQKAYIATTFFGKSGQDLVKTLDMGSEGLKQQAEEARKFGVVIGDEAVADATRFNDSLGRTKYAIQGFQNTLASKLLPTLQPLLDGMNDWIAENREWIATEIADTVKDFAQWLKQINWKDVIKSTVSFIKASAELFNKLGGLKTVATAVATIFGAKVGFAIANVGKSLIGLLNCFGPIGWAIALLGTAAYLWYENWDEICQGAQMLWEDLTDLVVSVWDTCINFVAQKIADVVDAFNEVYNFGGYLWDKAIDGCKVFYDFVIGIFNDIMSKALGVVTSITDSLKGVYDWAFGDDSVDVNKNTSQNIDFSDFVMTASSMANPTLINNDSKSEVVVKLMTEDNTKAEVVKTRSEGTGLRTNVLNTGATR